MVRRTVTAVAVAAAVALAALGALAPTASASTSSDAIGAVNDLRTAMGVEPITNDEALAGDCRLHATWMRIHSLLSHTETAGTTGYSTRGDDAAAHSVLHSAFGLVPQTSPDTIHWRIGAPLHLYQLLHPALVRSGYAHDGSYACMWTLNSKLRTDIDVVDPTRGRDQLFTWPPIGAVDVPLSEDTSGESPSPNEQLGLPRAQVTGPYTLVYANGFGNPGACGAIRILSATITASDGAEVPVRWWDDAKTIEKYGYPAGSCPVPSGGGFLVAEQPLTAGTTYTTRIELVGALVPLGSNTKVKSWTFRTSTGDTARPVVRVRSVSASRIGSTVAYRLVATVRDASSTTCTATVQRRRVRCVVRSGQVVLAGRMRGRPSSVAFAIVVRDSAGNQRRVRVARRTR